MLQYCIIVIGACEIIVKQHLSFGQLSHTQLQYSEGVIWLC